MTPNGTLQVVEDVESDSDDGPPPLGASDSDAASDSIPPPLVTDDESGDGDAGGDDEPTALTDLDSSEEEQSDDGEDSDIPSLLDGSDDSSDDNEVESDIESVPSGLAAASEEEDTDQLPNLDDPADESDSSDDEDMPDLDVNHEDSSGEEDLYYRTSSDDEGYGSRSNKFFKGSGIKQGFLGKKQPPNAASSSSSYGYSNQGVGRREDVGGAARRKQERSSAPYTGAGAGAREDLRGPSAPRQQQQQRSRPSSTPVQPSPEDYLRQSQQQSAEAAAASAAANKAEYNRWQGQAPRPKPKPARSRPEPAAYQPQPERAAELWQDHAAIEAFQRELKERRRAMNMHQEAKIDDNAAPVGRCCLNRGLHDRVEECRLNKLQALVEPQQKRMMMKCSAGCVLLWHMPCWREFQGGYEAETRESDPRQQGINITQALRVKDKSKPPTVHCVTPGCPGYINFLGSFEGPLGHETFKSMQYQPTKENLDVIKEVMAEEKQAAQEQRQAARAAAAAAKAAAALEAWRIKTNWKPGKPRKKRNKQVKHHTQQQQQQLCQQQGLPAANGNAAPPAVPVRAGASANGNDLNHQQQQQQQDPAAQQTAAVAESSAAAAAAAAAKPKGIQVKLSVKPINIARPASAKESTVRESTADDAGPSSSSSASVEGGASHSASQPLIRSEGRDASSQSPDQQQHLGQPSDHLDATNHTSLENTLAQQQQQQEQEAAAAGGRKKKKKKGHTFHLDELRTVVEAEDFNKQQQERMNRLSGIRPPRQHPQPSEPTAQQQQLQQPAAPSAGDFPTLNAASHHDDEQLAETDYLAQGLQDLKISADEHQRTSFVLLECVDFYMMQKRGENAEDVIRSIIYSKTGGEVIAMRLFERQEAVAVMLTNEVATDVFIRCHRHQLHRKQLQPSFMRQFPWDDELHKACPQYLTTEIREQLEQQQRELEQQQQASMQEAQQQRQQQQRQRPQLSAIPVPPEAKQLEQIAKQLPPAELMQRILEMQKAQAAATNTTAAAGASSSNGGAAVNTRTSAVAAAEAATAGLSRQQSQPAIRPPMPPPGSPPKQQQQPPPPLGRPTSALQQPLVAPGVHYVPPQAMPQYVHGLVHTPMGPMYGPVAPVYVPPASHTAAYGVPVIQQPQYVVGQTWQQQQQQAHVTDGDSYAEHHQGAVASRYNGQYDHGRGNGDGSNDQIYAAGNKVDDNGGRGGECDDEWQDAEHDGDWDGDAWPTEQLDSHQVECDDNQNTEGATQPAQHADSSSLAAGPQPQVRSRVAALEDQYGRSTSGSPATRLNPMAKEFKAPAGSTGTTPPAATPSRLKSASNGPTAASATPDMTSSSTATSSGYTAQEAPSAEGSTPVAAVQAAASAADGSQHGEAATASPGGSSSTSGDVPPAALAAATEEVVSAAVQDIAAVPDQPAAAGHADSAADSRQQATGPRQLVTTTASDSATASTHQAAAPAAAETRDSSSGQDSNGRFCSSNTNGIMATSSGSTYTSASGSSSPGPTFSSTSAIGATASEGPPADHIFDVILVVGCTGEQLRTVYRSPTTPVFGLSRTTLPGSERIITSESAGLIMYNVENQCVEGLWGAIAIEDGVVHWRLVAEYIEVPESVYNSVISLVPFKQRYEGQEAVIITRALWIWKHPPVVEPTPPIVMGRRLELPLATTLSITQAAPDVSGSAGADAMQMQQPSILATGPSNGSAAAPTASATSALHMAPPMRQLPDHITRLFSRPGSAGSGGGVATKNLRPTRVCPLCNIRESGWLVMGNCKGHMGPCIECVPRPPNTNTGYVMKPAAYPVCLADVDGHPCNKAVERLFKVVTT